MNERATYEKSWLYSARKPVENEILQFLIIGAAPQRSKMFQKIYIHAAVFSRDYFAIASVGHVPSSSARKRQVTC